MNTRYPMDGPFNTAVTSAALPLIDIKPTVAYKLNDRLAIGVSADIYTFASFLGEGQVEQQRASAGQFGSRWGFRRTQRQRNRGGRNGSACSIHR